MENLKIALMQLSPTNTTEENRKKGMEGIDLFPQTDKARKMTQKPIDIFPRTDEDI